MPKLLPILAAAGLTVGAVAAVPHQAAAQALAVQWGYGGGYDYAPPPPPPPPPYGARRRSRRIGPGRRSVTPAMRPRPWWR
jgi:hypothetical protein